MSRRVLFVSVPVLLCMLGSIGLGLVIVATLTNPLPKAVVVEVAPSVAPPTVTAKAVLVREEGTGSVVFQKEADTALPIASVTKLFSTALFWDGMNPLGTTSIIAADVAVEGRSGRLKAGQVYQNHELLFPALLESSNDVAAVMTRVAPFDMVAALNTFAGDNGAVQTTFADASGLSDKNVSTARELEHLFAVIKKDYPHIIDITTLKTHLNHVNAWMNNNPFIHEVGYRGGKHGYTHTANRTAVATFDETISGQTRPVAYVLLGSDDLAGDMAALRAYVTTAVTIQ